MSNVKEIKMFNQKERPADLVSNQVSETIQSALTTLDNLAVEKGHEIRAAISSGFKDLHRVLGDVERGTESTMDVIKGKGSKWRERIASQSTKAISNVNQQFRAKPWLFLGGFALLGIGVGYYIARRRNA